MPAGSPSILIVERDLTPGSPFLERLCRQGCDCAIARNLAEARAALAARKFDLVLSDMALPDGSAYPLLGALEGTAATLYFCIAVRNGCWWLPALRGGQRTWGQAALRPAEFMHELHVLLGEEAFSRSVEAAGAGDTPKASVIPMPQVELIPPKPERVQPVKNKAQKSSA